MSDINDVDDFVSLTVEGAFPTSSRNRGPRIEDSLGYEEERVKPGKIVQYAYFADGYAPTTATTTKLPAGCYDIHANQGTVYAVPVSEPSGLLLELPEMRSEQVLKVVENFWNSEKDYKEGNEFVIGGAAFKAGVMIFGPPGCHGKGTKILMFDGTTKNVENVAVGDLLMGPDSKPKEVLRLARGRQTMVKINPVKGESFIINMGHILHLSPSGSEVLTTTNINISFENYLKQGNNFKERYKLTRTGIEFPKKKLPIEPYMLGLWLGDGTSHVTDITTMDLEIVGYLQEYAARHNMKLVHRESSTKGRASTYGLTNGIGKKNPMLTALQELELIRNKHIPHLYKTGSRSQRLEVLAGLLDSDGHLSGGGFDFISKFERLALDVLYLARSLGFAAYIKETEKSCQNDFTGTYFRLSISGNVAEIPCKLPRKQAEERKQIKNVLRTGFSYEILPENDYYGFTLDGDHLYLTDDFTIHHNSGKSCTIKLVCRKLVKEHQGTVFYASGHPGLLTSFLSGFAAVEPNRKCLVIFEDIDALVSNYGEAAYLEILDSAKTIDNVLFIATTNYPERLDARIYNRPGRFSHVIKIGLPEEATRAAYLKAVLKNHRDVDYIVANTKDFTIDHLSALINAVYREKKDLVSEIARLRKLFKMPKLEDNKAMGIGSK